MLRVLHDRDEVTYFIRHRSAAGQLDEVEMPRARFGRVDETEIRFPRFEAHEQVLLGEYLRGVFVVAEESMLAFGSDEHAHSFDGVTPFRIELRVGARDVPAHAFEKRLAEWNVCLVKPNVPVALC